MDISTENKTSEIKFYKFNDNTNATQNSSEPTDKKNDNLNSNDNVADATNSNEEMANEDELGKAMAETAEWKDKYLRLFAEFDNFKKRSFKEKMEILFWIII